MFEQARFNLVIFFCLILIINFKYIYLLSHPCYCWSNLLFSLVSLIYAQVTALSNVEAKKRFEFLEAVSGTMDAHLRYFKQVSLLASSEF